MKARLFSLTLLLIFTFELLSQSRNPSFYCSCSGNGQSPFPAPYTKYRHYQFDGNGQEIIIAQFCNYIEFPPHYKVAADGGSSIIEIRLQCSTPYDPFSFLDDPNYDLNEFALGDFDTNGELEILQRYPTVLFLRYKHPTIPPAGVKSFSVHPNLGLFGAEIEIFHAPVVMIHGLWADPSSFTDMETFLLASNLYEPWQLYKADYSSSHAASFATNADVAKKAIDQVLGQYWDSFVATSKANVVCHSMGGLLTRMFTKQSNYPSYKSVNKLITCNTPHQGSQMANWLLDTSSAGGLAAAALLNLVGYSCFGGAVENLRTNSTALGLIQSAPPKGPIRVHAINTIRSHSIGSPSTSSFIGNPLESTLYQIASTCGNNYVTDIFDSDESDLVVALESQVGGLGGIQTSVFSDQMHVGSTANGAVMASVLAKLNLPNNDASFADKFEFQFLNYGVGSNCIFDVKSQKKSEAKVSASSISIISPVTNQNITAGNNVSVSFTSSEVDSVYAYLAHTQQNFAIKKAKFSENTFTLPTDITLLGPVKLVLVGFSPTKELVASATVTINQTTDATLNSIYVYPPSIYLHTTDSLAISIFGKYSDNIDRNITNDNSITFGFKQGNATKLRANIILNQTENDTLLVNISTPINFRKAANALLTDLPVFINALDVINAPLPLNLISFTGKNTEKGNHLEWKTANETNFSHFEIERSSPLAPSGRISSQKFEKIGKKDSNNSEIYEYLDNSQLSNHNSSLYYRLRMVDLDGKFTYSKIIYLENKSQQEIGAFPNPFSNQISIDNSENKELKISLIDMTGREIIKPVNSNSQKVDLNTEKIGTGIYFLQIKDFKTTKILKFIKN
jgi:pimeloyl-ACP methyl ester carboxylesterase